MTFQYCSDLHLEFGQNAQFLKSNPIIPEGEILLLAGDIVQFDQMEKHKDFFDYISDHFSACYWVPGNHEYYHSNLAQRSGEFIENIRDNIFLLNNSIIKLPQYRLIFTTLWSSISQLMEKHIERGMSDFHLIYQDGQLFTPHLYNKLHQRSVNFLTNSFQEDFEGTTIVISHHLPTLKNYPIRYRDSAINEAFATNLDSLISSSGAGYWLYGHHHQFVPDFQVGGTTMLTNQLGYVSHGEHHQFCRTKCLRLT